MKIQSYFTLFVICLRVTVAGMVMGKGRADSRVHNLDLIPGMLGGSKTRIVALGATAPY